MKSPLTFPTTHPITTLVSEPSKAVSKSTSPISDVDTRPDLS